MLKDLATESGSMIPSIPFYYPFQAFHVHNLGTHDNLYRTQKFQ